jgi:hypothetical protein
MKPTKLHLFAFLWILVLSGCNTTSQTPTYSTYLTYFVEGSKIRTTQKEKTYLLLVREVSPNLAYLPYYSYLDPLKHQLSLLGYKEVTELSAANYFIQVNLDSSGPSKSSALGQVWDVYDLSVDIAMFDNDVYWARGREKASTTESSQASVVWLVSLTARVSYDHPSSVLPNLIETGSPYVFSYDGPPKRILETKS